MGRSAWIGGVLGSVPSSLEPCCCLSALIYTDTECVDDDGGFAAYQKCTVFNPMGLSHALLNQLAFAAPCASDVVLVNRLPARVVFLAKADVNCVREALLRIGRAVRKIVAIVTERCS